MGVGSYLMPSVLTRFREDHPGADITLNVVQPQETMRQVAAGEADFAVSTWDAEHTRTNIRSVVVRDEPLVLVVRADMRPGDGTLPLEAALRLPFVGAPRVVAAQRSLIAQLRRVTDIEPSFVIRLGHALSAKQAVIDHGWAAILPQYVVEADVAAGSLAVVDVPGLELRERIVMAWRRDKVFSKLQERLMEQLRGELAAGSSGPVAT
jgi:DNA-binding transcriptional LysR family regulator